jgi:hypothetical protein
MNVRGTEIDKNYSNHSSIIRLFIYPLLYVVKRGGSSQVFKRQNSSS